MGERLVADLRETAFTYDEVGATAEHDLPSGYNHIERTRELSQGAFDAAAERLMTWRIHEAAGLAVAASSQRVDPDAVVEMFLGPRWLGIRAACRVVYVIDEAERVGFAYGTLPGHAESGEESFIVERQDDQVRFTVRAFSNPATRLARLGGPVATAVQRLMTERYLRAAEPGR